MLYMSASAMLVWKCVGIGAVRLHECMGSECLTSGLCIGPEYAVKGARERAGTVGPCPSPRAG